jgi:outer membrane protein TolC
MKIHILFFACMLTGSVQAQLTLQTCQEKAKANYPLIKQYDLITKSTEYTISNANKAYLPQVNVTAIGAYIFKGLPSITPPGGTPTESEKAQLIGIAQINQTIWDGGATRTQKQIIKAGAEVEKASVDVSLYSIRERVNQLYFGILVIDAQLNQLNVLRQNIERNLNAVTLSKNNGLAYQTDIDELNAELMNLDQRAIEFKYTRDGYVTMLSYVTGQPIQKGAQFDKPIITDSIASPSINRPEQMLFAKQRDLVTAQSSLNRVYNMPKIGLLGAGIWMEPGVNIGSAQLSSLAIGGVSLSWNTSGLYTTSTNKQLEKINLDKISNQEETFTFNTNLQLHQVSADVQKQRAILAKDQEIVQLKSKIRNGYQIKYENGVSSMNELIQAMNKESEARSQEALHQVQLLMTLYNYQTISGN